MLLRNVSPLGGLEIPLIGRVIEGGAEFEVLPDHARRLLLQSGIFEPVDDEAKAVAFDLHQAVAESAEAATVDAGEELPPTLFDDGFTPDEPAAAAPVAAVLVPPADPPAEPELSTADAAPKPRGARK